MKAKNLLIAVGLFVGVQLAARSAWADYICSTNYHPTSGTLGSDGYLTLALTSEPNCEGTATNTHFLCTTGATSTACAANASFRYERLGLLAVFRGTQDAANTNQRVFVSTIGCNGGSGSCGARVTFYAD